MARTLVFASLLISACAPLPGQGEPPQLFTLTPKSTFPEDLPSVNWQLLVEVPVAGDSLNTDRIALHESPLTLDYYAKARWTERAPIMLQRLIVESFENTQRMVAVGRQAIDLRADFILKTELREFQAQIDDDGIPHVRVRIIAKLVKMPERRIVANHSVEKEMVAEGQNITAVIETFDDATGKVIKKLTVWAIRALFWQS
jgi:cholesterol transport system auxiliary component